MYHLCKLALIAIVSNFVLLGAWAQESKGGVYIDVGQAQVKKSVMALTPLKYFGPDSANKRHISLGDNLYRTIHQNLDVSNYFTFLNPDGYLENPEKIGLKPAPGEVNGFNFDKWKTSGAEFLFRAGYRVVGGKITLDTYVYHIPKAALVMGKSYTGGENDYNLIAHTFSNDLIKALTGKPGAFLTKLVAVRQEAGKSGNQITKEIFLMDWDGRNQAAITNHSTISMSPAWSTAGDKIAYTSFAYHSKQKVRNADLFIYDIKSAKRFLVSYRKGINSGAAFAPGDNFLLLTLSSGGQADIYRMTSDGKTITPLTRGPAGAMNVEPAISPDGKQVAFSSDRAGRPMIYIMNIDGSNVRRITFAGKYNASPVWSPDGKQIAFAGQDSSHFDIFVINADKTNMKRLTSAKKKNGAPANNESPSWSPDGRNIAFSSDRTGQKQLYLVSPDGSNERQITSDPKYIWDRPKWSPFLND